MLDQKYQKFENVFNLRQFKDSLHLIDPLFYYLS